MAISERFVAGRLAFNFQLSDDHRRPTAGLDGTVWGGAGQFHISDGRSAELIVLFVFITEHRHYNIELLILDLQRITAWNQHAYTTD